MWNVPFVERSRSGGEIPQPTRQSGSERRSPHEPRSPYPLSRVYSASWLEDRGHLTCHIAPISPLSAHSDQTIFIVPPNLRCTYIRYSVRYLYLLVCSEVIVRVTYFIKGLRFMVELSATGTDCGRYVKCYSFKLQKQSFLLFTFVTSFIM